VPLSQAAHLDALLVLLPELDQRFAFLLLQTLVLLDAAQLDDFAGLSSQNAVHLHAEPV